MAHLGARVSALVDGQLGPEEEERAWEHVHGCHACRDLVEHEGWVKTRLLGLSLGEETPPSHLRGALTDPDTCADRVGDGRARQRRRGLAVGGGVVGAAVLGVLAVTVPPSTTGGTERRPPTTAVNSPVARVTGSTTAGVVLTSTEGRVAPHHGSAGVAGVRMVP